MKPIWNSHLRLGLFFMVILLISIASNNSNAQCYPDRHNTSLNSHWLSCSSSVSPNPNRPRGYWLLYELEERKAVSSLKMWNLNHPEHLHSGIKSFTVDYINPDGSWSEHSAHSLAMAEASGFYEGEEIELPGEFVTDKVLLSFSENHGGNCYGIGEVRIGLIDKTTATEDIAADHFDIEIVPNPFTDLASVTINKLEQKEVNYEIINSLGQVISAQKAATLNGKAQFDIFRNKLPAGTYFLKIIDGIKVSTRKISISNK